MSPFVWYVTSIRGSACTPMTLAQHLRDVRPLMLIEGVRVGGRTCSVLAAGATMSFRAHGRDARMWGAAGEPIPLADAPDPLGQLYRAIEELSWATPEGPIELLPDPRMLSSWLGFISYDAARCFERLPERAMSHQRRSIPDYAFFRPARLVVFDPAADRIVLAAHSPAPRDLAQLTALADWMRSVREPAKEPEIKVADAARLRRRLTSDGYVERVRRAKEYILDGEIFQVVLSLPCEMPTEEHPLDLYARLRKVNPSPLEYCYMDADGLALVGASPEPLVTFEDGKATIRALAGTRGRGRSPADDEHLERELRSSVKELAEHRMLVDLARNDLGRVCRLGSVEVAELFTVERYSHVMHLVSEITGQLAPEAKLDALLRSCFPAGTMTGTPKVRAMEIIDELEPISRGIYAGGVGLLAPNWMRLYLAIRSLVISDGIAYAQAGAGIVYDSNPEAEYAECVAKLGAPLTALGIPPDAP